ncbi:MAG: hypothetical protein VX514_01815 [Candidatus Thermoplasmatota archaeon]|nr:hypothetical protein [Candidatus Thermoplasmatota archaeon]
MKEAKKTFPGSIISKILFVFSLLASGGLFVGSIFSEGEDVSGITDHLHLPKTEFFGIDSTYYLAVALVLVATTSNQHKAVFTKREDEDKVHFWKQITPYFRYGKREFNVDDLSYWVKKRKTRDYPLADITDTDYGKTTTIYTTYLYENKKKFFVLDGETDYFREILGKGPSRSPMHRNSLVDLMINFIRRG